MKTKTQQFIEHHWPEARLGLDYDLEGEKITVWSSSFGEAPTPSELETWSPEQPDLGSRKRSDNPVLLLDELKALVQRAEQIVEKLNLEGNP